MSNFPTTIQCEYIHMFIVSGLFATIAFNGFSFSVTAPTLIQFDFDLIAFCALKRNLYWMRHTESHLMRVCGNWFSAKGVNDNSYFLLYWTALAVHGMFMCVCECWTGLTASRVSVSPYCHRTWKHSHEIEIKTVKSFKIPSIRFKTNISAKCVIWNT